jgi:FeS assembly SUF system protein
MNEEATASAADEARHVRLNVLPHSGKIDQLKREMMSNPQPTPPGEPSPAEVQEDPPAPSAGGDHPPRPAVQQTPRQREIEIKVLGALRTIYDPELPVNIYDLGLIYEVAVDETDAVRVKMTLTAPACPVAGSLPGEVERKIESIPEVRTADVELVWEPPWTRDRMSEEAMLDLGMM